MTHGSANIKLCLHCNHFAACGRRNKRNFSDRIRTIYNQNWEMWGVPK